MRIESWGKMVFAATKRERDGNRRRGDRGEVVYGK